MQTPRLASGLHELSVTPSKSIPSVVAGGFPIPFGLGRNLHDLNGRRGDARGIMARSGSSRIPLGASTVSYGRRNDDNDDAFHFPEGQTNFVAECDLPTARGNFRMRAYSYRGAKVVMRDGEKVLEWHEMEPVVIYKGNLRGSTEAVVRVHDQCYTSEVLGSMRCDCREQLELALDYIEQHGGLVVYMPQEGRGIGLANKIAAYQLQDGGLDTVDANRALGFGDDERSYACVPYMLKDMGIERIRLMTNNPFKIRQLAELGINIVGARPHVVEANDFNIKYLRTKAKRMAHLLPSLDKDSLAAPPDGDSRAVLASRDTSWLPNQASETQENLRTESVESALRALQEGVAVIVLDRIREEAWLVAGASVLSMSSLALMSKLGDSLSVTVADTAIEALGRYRQVYSKDKLDAGTGGDGKCSRESALQSVQTRRVSLVRRLAAAVEDADKVQAEAMLRALPSPLATVLGPLKRAGSWTATDGRNEGSAGESTWERVQTDCAELRMLAMQVSDTHSNTGDAVMKLLGLARLPAIAVSTLLMAEDRTVALSIASVEALAEDSDIVITSVEEVANFKAAKFLTDS